MTRIIVTITTPLKKSYELTDQQGSLLHRQHTQAYIKHKNILGFRVQEHSLEAVEGLRHSHVPSHVCWHYKYLFFKKKN